MSRLDDLVAELCPNGVDYAVLGSLVSRPATIRWSDRADGEEFQYIDLTSVDRRTHAIGDTVTITRADAPSRAQQIVEAGDVIFGTTRPMLKRYARIPNEYAGQICSTGFCVLRPDPARLLSSYLLHAMGAPAFCAYVEANQRGASYPAIPDQVVRRFRLPVPPLEIQREIAVILDNMEKRETELETKLETERISRRRQFEYYRDDLLTFTEQDKVRWVTFGSVATIVRGGSPRPIQAYLTDADDGMNWIKIGDVEAGGKFITHTSEKIKPEGASKSRRVEPGDFVLSNSMSFGRPYIVQIEGCIHDGWLAIKDFAEQFVPDFLYHLLRSTAVYRAMAQRAGAGTVQNLNADIVKSLVLPVPDTVEQDRIVSILDKFDFLVNDLSVVLPAELKARRRQYEYYRDRLLTFEERREHCT